MMFELDDDGHIAAIHSVVASLKLTTLPEPG